MILLRFSLYRRWRRAHGWRTFLLHTPGRKGAAYLCARNLPSAEVVELCSTGWVEERTLGLDLAPPLAQTFELDDLGEAQDAIAWHATCAPPDAEQITGPSPFCEGSRCEGCGLDLEPRP